MLKRIFSGEGSKMSYSPIPQEEFDDVLPKKIGNSEIISFCLILSFILGSGFLLQPYVVSQAGVIVVVFLWITVSSTTIFSNALLIEALKCRGIHDYCHLVEDTFGRAGFWSVNVCIFTQCGGCIVGYFVIMINLIETLITYFGGSSGWYSGDYFLAGVIVLVSIPLTAYRVYADMMYVGIASLILVFIATLFIMIDGPLNQVDSSDLNLGSFTGSCKTIGFLLVALNATVSLPTLAKNYDESNTYSFQFVQTSAVLFGTVLLFSLGVVGYLSFREYTDVNVLDNFSGSAGAAIQLIVLLHLLSYLAGNVVYCREVVYHVLFEKDSIARPAVYQLLNVFVLGGFGMLSAGLTSTYGFTTTITEVINIAGGISAALLTYVFPALVAIRHDRSSSLVRFGAYSLIVFGLFCVSTVTYGSIVV